VSDGSHPECTESRQHHLALKLPAHHRLFVTFDVRLGGVRFDWKLPESDAAVAIGRLLPHAVPSFRWFALDWQFEMAGRAEADGCNAAPSSVRALLKRIRQRLPLQPGGVAVGFRLDAPLDSLKADVFHEIQLPDNQDWSAWLARPVRDFARLVDGLPRDPEATPQLRGRVALWVMIRNHLALPPEPTAGRPAPSDQRRLLVTVETVGGFIQFDWSRPGDGAVLATGRVTTSGPDGLTWQLTVDGATETAHSSYHLNAIRARLRRWFKPLPVANENVSARTVTRGRSGGRP
jgi:hypothetical protein